MKQKVIQPTLVGPLSINSLHINALISALQFIIHEKYIPSQAFLSVKQLITNKTKGFDYVKFVLLFFVMLKIDDRYSNGWNKLIFENQFSNSWHK